MTYCGLNVDYKTGCGGKKAMAVVKQNGVQREILNDIPLENLPPLPHDLYPLPAAKYELYGLDDGDGRNQNIYKHIKLLQNYGLKPAEIGEYVEFINNKVFKEPLAENELKPTILSAFKDNAKSEEDDLFYEDEKGNIKLDIFSVAEKVAKNFDLRIFNGKFYFLSQDKTGKESYIANNSTNNILREVMNRLDLKLKKAQDAELMHQLTKIAKIEPSNKLYPIRLNNGFILDGADVLHLDTVFTPYNLDVAYDPNAADETVINYIRWFCCNDEGLIKLFEEILGHILMVSGFPHHIFFFIANSGKNGKSMTLTMCQNFVGDLHSSIALEEFDKQEYLYAINGKLVNCGDDIDASMIEKSRAVKTLAAGNEISCRALYENPIKMKSVATLLFSCNEMPNFKDKTGGIARRVVCFPCDAHVETIDMKLDQKLSTSAAKSTLLNLAIKGMKRIIANGGELTKVEAVALMTERYLIESDNVAMFFEETDMDSFIDNINNTFAKLYVLYCNWCTESGYYSLSKKRFSNRLKEFGLETYKNNSTVKVRRDKYKHLI